MMGSEEDIHACLGRDIKPPCFRRRLSVQIWFVRLLIRIISKELL